MDEPNFSLIVQLDDREHPDLDLEASGVGEWALDLAVERMIRNSLEGMDPQGHYWCRLAPITERRKGHSMVGIDTGKTGVIDPATFEAGTRDMGTRACMWTHAWANNPRRRGQLEGWQFGAPEENLPARPLIGWNREDVRAIEERVREEDAKVRHQADE